MKKLQSEATQKKIQNAVIELILEKDYNNITIGEIAKKSGINRTTFYLFYSSKEELIKELYFTFMDWYIEDLSHALFMDRSDSRKLILNDFEKMRKDANVIKALFSIQMNGFVPYQEMKYAIENAVRTKLKDSAPDDTVSIVAKTYASSAVTTVEWWIENCTTHSTEYVYGIIHTCVNEGLFKLLHK